MNCVRMSRECLPLVYRAVVGCIESIMDRYRLPQRCRQADDPWLYGGEAAASDFPCEAPQHYRIKVPVAYFMSALRR